MADFEVRSVKFRQPLACQCGRPLARADVSEALEGIEIVCTGCHQTVLEIQIETFAEAEPWD